MQPLAGCRGPPRLTVRRRSAAAGQPTAVAPPSQPAAAGARGRDELTGGIRQPISADLRSSIEQLTEHRTAAASEVMTGCVQAQCWCAACVRANESAAATLRYATVDCISYTIRGYI